MVTGKSARHTHTAALNSLRKGLLTESCQAGLGAPQCCLADRAQTEGSAVLFTNGPMGVICQKVVLVLFILKLCTGQQHRAAAQGSTAQGSTAWSSCQLQQGLLKAESHHTPTCQQFACSSNQVTPAAAAAGMLAATCPALTSTA